MNTHVSTAAYYDGGGVDGDVVDQTLQVERCAAALVRDEICVWQLILAHLQQQSHLPLAHYLIKQLKYLCGFVDYKIVMKSIQSLNRKRGNIQIFT